MRRGLAVLCLGALTACGSTVQVSSQLSSGDPAQQGLGVVGGTASAAPTSAVRGGTGGAPGAGGSSGGSSSTSTATDMTSTTRAVPQVGTQVGPRSPVAIGIRIPNHQADAVVGNVTGSQLDMGDPKAMAQAMVDWVNGHGGLAGHPLRPVFYENCGTLSCDQSVEDQAICASFTQDHKVVAMVDSTTTSVALASCLARAGTPVLGGGVAFFDEQDLRTAQGLYSPYLLPADVAFTQLVHRLVATHWFAPGDKLGLLAVDTPTFRRTAALTKREMAAAGHAFADEAYWSANPNDVSGIVLRFKAAGVKRIVIVDTGSQVLLQFGPAMSAQGYYPKVSVTSADVLGTLALIASPQTLDGAGGVAWQPVVDGAANAPRPTSTATLCAQIYKAARVGTSGPLAGAFAAAYCDGFLFAQSSYGRAGALSLGALRSAVFGLGTAYVPATTFASRFRTDTYAGAASTRDIRYDTSCSCFRYTSPELPVP